MRALAMGLAILGLCVFAWGLRYKLSLYDPPHSISRHMPAAKLITGKERSVVSLTAIPRPVRAPIAPFAVSTLPLVFLAYAAARSLTTVRGSSLRPLPAPVTLRCALSSLSFVRPPPRLLSSAI